MPWGADAWPAIRPRRRRGVGALVRDRRVGPVPRWESRQRRGWVVGWAGPSARLPSRVPRHDHLASAPTTVTPPYGSTSRPVPPIPISRSPSAVPLPAFGPRLRLRPSFPVCGSRLRFQSLAPGSVFRSPSAVPVSVPVPRSLDPVFRSPSAVLVSGSSPSLLGSSPSSLSRFSAPVPVLPPVPAPVPVLPWVPVRVRIRPGSGSRPIVPGRPKSPRGQPSRPGARLMVPLSGPGGPAIGDSPPARPLHPGPSTRERYGPLVGPGAAPAWRPRASATCWPQATALIDVGWWARRV